MVSITAWVGCSGAKEVPPVQEGPQAGKPPAAAGTTPSATPATPAAGDKAIARVPEAFLTGENAALEPAEFASMIASSEDRNKLKMAVLGVHNYHDSNNELVPLGSADSEGERLSWRVRLLPYLSHGELYEKFDQNAAWDSPQNKAACSTRCRTMFQSPGVTATGMTSTARDRRGEHDGSAPTHKTNSSSGGITDGLGYTGLFFIGGPETAVPWTKPGGLPFDENTDPVAALGAVEGKGFAVGMADGSVTTFPRDKETLRALITRNGGEAYKYPELD